MEISGKTIEILNATVPGAPLVILNSYQKSGVEILRHCRDLGCPDFTLAEITGLNWNDDLSPWKLSQAGGEAFGGKAEGYLAVLLRDLLPAIKAALSAPPSRVLLAGYSLAGLFALYAAAGCGEFQAVASCSGSLWYPGFTDYLKARDPALLPQTVYLSLGDREARTKNETLRTVEDNTRELAQYFAQRGIDAVFELNKGNHFHQAALRTAKGICWILGRLNTIL